MRQVTILTFVSAILSVGCFKATKDPMPSFNVLLSDSVTILNTKDIPSGAPIVMIHFDATCRECQQETDSLLLNMKTLQNVSFYFFTVGEFSEVTTFKNYYHFDRYSNITIGQDYEKFIVKHFNSYETPLVLIYDKRKRLSAVFKGKPNIGDIINQIKN